MLMRIRYKILGSHYHLKVFMGPFEGALGLSGTLVMNFNEFTNFIDHMREGKLVKFDVIPD